MLDAAGKAKTYATSVTPKAAASLGSLAAALMESGESLGSDGSVSAVLGLKLFHRLQQLEALTVDVSPVLAERLTLDADGLAKRAGTLDAPGVDLRDLLAPLIDATAAEGASVPGWGVQAAQIPWSAATPLIATNGDETTRLASLRSRLELALESPAYAPAAATWSAMLADVLGMVASPPAYVTGLTRSGFTSSVKAALFTLADHPNSPKGADELARLANLARIGRALESPTAAGEAGTAIGSGLARAQQAWNKAAAASPVLADSGKERQRTAMLARAAALLRDRRELAGSKDLVRQLKPAMRTLNELAKLSENELSETLPDALPHPDASTLPKLVAATAEHKRRLDDIKLLRDLDLKLASGDGNERAVSKEFLPVAERALAFSKDVLELARRDDPQSKLELLDAMDRWRRLAARAADVVRMPGEGDLRKTDSSLSILLSDRRDALIKVLDADRAAWIKAWAAPDRTPAQAVTDRLERIRQAMAIAQDAAAAIGTGPMLANRLPCWEIDHATRATLTKGLDQAIRDLVQQATAAGQIRLADGAPILDTHGLALLLGRLERLQAGTPAASTAWDAAADLAAGAMPADAALADRAADLAMLARYAPEWARMDNAGRTRLLKFLRPALARCLSELESK